MARPGEAAAPGPAAEAPYDVRRLSYASTFEDPLRAGTIRAIEWMTGKARLLRLIRAFEASGVPQGPAFWPKALSFMRIAVETPAEEIARIPAEGPVLVVANHPHGLVDGIVLADLLGRVRRDYRILTRSLLTGVAPIAEFMIPVPFPHAADAQAASVAMRRAAMAHLRAGGAIALFPAGSVAVAPRPFAAPQEGKWSAFTANLALRSGAAVLPVRFPGANSRAYQLAHHVSATLRQGLLLHEVVAALGRPQAPIVGEPIPPEEVARLGEPLRLAAALRERTLALTRI